MLVKEDNYVEIDSLYNLYEVLMKDWFNDIEVDDWLHKLEYDQDDYFDIDQEISTIEERKVLENFLNSLPDWKEKVKSLCKQANNLILIQEKENEMGDLRLKLIKIEIK